LFQVLQALFLFFSKKLQTPYLFDKKVKFIQQF